MLAVDERSDECCACSSLRSPARSISAAPIARHLGERSRGEGLFPFYSPKPVTSVEVSCASSRSLARAWLPLYFRPDWGNWWIIPVVDHQAVNMTFFWCYFGFKNACGAGSMSTHEPIVDSCRRGPTPRCTSQYCRESGRSLCRKVLRRFVTTIFLVLTQFMLHPFVEFLGLPDVPEMLSNSRAACSEFFCMFSNCGTRISD